MAHTVLHFLIRGQLWGIIYGCIETFYSDELLAFSVSVGQEEHFQIG